MQWADKGKQVVEDMVQRFRMWRARHGQILANPLLDSDSSRDETKNAQGSLFDSPLRFEESVVEFDGIEEEEEDSVVVDA